MHIGYHAWTKRIAGQSKDMRELASQATILFPFLPFGLYNSYYAVVGLGDLGQK